jgi:hypothetical protein
MTLSVGHDMSGLTVMALITRVPFALGRWSCGFEANGLNELVEIVDDAGRGGRVASGAGYEAERKPAVKGGRHVRRASGRLGRSSRRWEGAGRGASGRLFDEALGAKF